MSEMPVRVVDHMGSDLTVVNAARVSFGKTVSEMSEKDTKLIRYLAKHGHWSPFGHCSVQFHIKAPVFVARQLVKHQIGLTWNEISRRYVDTEVEFYDVDKWRGRAEDKKQGSDEEVDIQFIDRNTRTAHLQLDVERTAKENYNRMLEAGIAPEQARFVLPQGMYTEWYWTGSLAAFARFYSQRIDEHAQWEIREYAKAIGEIIEPLFRVSWKYLTAK